MSLQSPTRSKLAIGLVEDSDEDHIAFTRVVARDAPGVTVTRWSRAEAVLQSIEDGVDPETWPNILVVDLNLPGMDGCELVGRLRQHPVTRALPAVVLSGSGRQHDIDRCYAAGANAYLTKPNSSTELGALLKMLLASIAQFRAPTPVGRSVPEAAPDASGESTAGTVDDDPASTDALPSLEEQRAAYERQLIEERDTERRGRQRAEALQRVTNRLANAMTAAQVEEAVVGELVQGGIARGAKVVGAGSGSAGPGASFSADPSGPGTIGLLPLLATSGSMLAQLRVELDHELGDDQEAFLHEVASLARTALERIARLATMMRQSAGTSSDLPTRRWLSAAVTAAMRQAVAKNEHLTAVAVEIDGFERYIAQHGHVSADSLLLAVTDAWRRAGHDLLSRTGGEQFTALLAGATERDALELIRGIRRQPSVKHAFSVGIAQWNRREDGAALLARAEAAVAADRE